MPRSTEYETAKEDEQVGIKILGGLGQRNADGDLRHANQCAALLIDMVETKPEDVECMICLVKTRNKGATVDQDTYNVHGGVAGSEIELTALMVIIAARIRQLRAVMKEAQDVKMANKTN